MPKTLILWACRYINTLLGVCANPLPGLDGRGLYLHRLCLNLIAARRMSGSELCAARRKAYLAAGRPKSTSIGHTFLQTCGAYISA